MEGKELRCFSVHVEFASEHTGSKQLIFECENDDSPSTGVRCVYVYLYTNIQVRVVCTV